MVDKKLSEFDEVSNGDVSFFPVLDNNTKNGKLAATKAMPWTNCITEIPQDIKLSLNNGTLTLLAGSKAYIPNGSGVFNAVTITTDKTISSGLANGLNFIEIDESNSNLSGRLVANSVSGAGVTTAAGLAYDTTTNRVGFYNANGSFSKYVSFPIAIVNVESSVITSIVQVFNGFGYIGSTVFALPGVKGLIPNGRNADGTLKNSTFTTSSVLTVAVGSGSTTDILRLTSAALQRGSINYNEEFNYNYVSTYSPSNIRSVAIIGSVSYVSGKITSITPKTTFHVVDYSEFKEMISAIDEDTMKLSGAQTASGPKTFTGQLISKRNDNDARIVNQYTNYTKGTAPSATQHSGIIIKDSAGVEIANVGCIISTGNATTLQLLVKDPGAGTSTAKIAIIYPADGTAYTQAPTPSSVTDNSTKIATTQWFNNKVKQVSTLPANPTAGVYYFVTE